MRSLERFRQSARRSIQRYFGIASHTPQGTGVQRTLGGAQPTWMSFPEALAEPIQILDRGDPDFGAFLWTLDFDPIG